MTRGNNIPRVKLFFIFQILFLFQSVGQVGFFIVEIVTLMVTEFFHELARGVANLHRNREVAELLHVFRHFEVGVV